LNALCAADIVIISNLLLFLTQKHDYEYSI